VGDDLTIRRFTPMAEQVFNVLPTDVSRPIGQLKPNIVADDLTELIRDTIESVSPHERDVQDRQGRWYSLRIRPYKGVDNRLEGAVVAAVDIDAAKRRQTETQEVRDQVRAMLEAVRQPLLVLDADLRVRMANDGFLELMRTTEAAIEGVPIYELRNGQWGSSNLREELERLATSRADDGSSVGESLSMDGAKRMKLNARRLKSDDTRRWILVSFERPRDGEINP
jgi:two-component system CheB/CheR fusion protein